jgi:hypothetical protein
MTRWNPWQTLRASDATFWFTAFPASRGLWTRIDGQDEILLEETLDRRTRREVLGHELVHMERGIGRPSATDATMQLEEDRVWRVAVRRLAPPAEVREFLERRGSVGPVTIEDVAEEFDLTIEGATRVARLLALEDGRIAPPEVRWQPRPEPEPDLVPA